MFDKKEWYKINKKRILENQKIYKKIYSKTLSGIFTKIKHNAKKRNIIINFSKEDFIKWYDTQCQKCYYCNRTLKQTKKDKIFNNNSYRLSIDRKNNNEGYKLNNLVLACFNCNRIKSNVFTEQQMLKIGIVLQKIFNN